MTEHHLKRSKKGEKECERKKGKLQINNSPRDHIQ